MDANLTRINVVAETDNSSTLAIAITAIVVAFFALMVILCLVVTAFVVRFRSQPTQIRARSQKNSIDTIEDIYCEATTQTEEVIIFKKKSARNFQENENNVTKNARSMSVPAVPRERTGSNFRYGDDANRHVTEQRKSSSGSTNGYYPTSDEDNEIITKADVNENVEVRTSREGFFKQANERRRQSGTHNDLPLASSVEPLDDSNESL